MDLSNLPNDVIDVIRERYFEIIKQRCSKLFRIIDRMGFLDSVNYHDDIRSSFLMHRRLLNNCLENNDIIKLLTRLNIVGKQAAKWIFHTETAFANMPEKKSVINLIYFIYSHLPLTVQSKKLDEFPDDLDKYTCIEVQSLAYHLLVQ